MNNEQTKILGRIAFEAFDSAQDLGDYEHWYQQPSSVQAWWEASASAVISHVLQGAKYVLLEVDQFHQQGDECLLDDEGWQPVADHWFGKIVGSGPPCRRPISLPSSVRPEGKIGGLAELYQGKPEGPSTASPASSGDAGADTRPRCKSCHCYMTPGKAIPEAVVNLGESQQTTGSHVGNAPMVDVWKCPECGHSFRCEAQTEWRPKKERALPTDGRYETVEDFMRASGISEDVQREVASSLPKSAEPVVEKEPSDDLLGGVISAWAAEPGLRNQVETLTSERDQLRKELEVLRRKTDNRGVLSVTEEDETYREQCWKMMYNTVFQDLDEHRKKVSTLTTENAALKEERDAALAREEQAKKNWSMVVDQALEMQKELTRLRSQFRWTPISTPPATEDLAKPLIYAWGENLQHVATGKWGMGRPVPATHWSISPFTLPSPPETEEQAMRREFEEWARSSHELRHVSYELTGLMGNYVSSRLQDAWLGYQAAKQSTKEQA